MRSGSPDTKDLADTLDSIIVSLSKEGKDGFLVMDALDECREEVGREAILRQIKRLNENHKNLHILVTSRREEDIIESLEEVATPMDINDYVADDIESFVRLEVDKMIKKDPWKGVWRDKMESSIIRAEEKFVAPPPFVLKREV